ncbi:MAG: hypothetical protein AB7L13_08000 [Acidimicrobiia bacterium]
MENNTFARSLHDLGAAAWFGGALMGAIGLNGASREVTDDKERLIVADAGWSRWAPVNAAAIGAHLLGGALLLVGNKGRVAGQKGVAGVTTAKMLVTLGAVGVTAYSGMAGKKLKNAGRVPVTSATEPSGETPDQVAQCQRQQKVLQWAIPALTGSVIVISALMGEQQRPKNVAHGLVERAGRWIPDGLHSSLHSLPETLHLS